MTTDANLKINYDTIVLHRIDLLTSGRQSDPLDLLLAQDDVNQKMLRIIERRGHTQELLAELGLCSLCGRRRS